MNDLEHRLEASLAEWFSEIHMSQVVKRKKDGQVIATVIPADEEDDYSINLTTLARALAADLDALSSQLVDDKGGAS